MWKTRIVASAAAIAVVAALSGCATPNPGAGDTSPYVGRHDHNRDAKQGAAGSYAVPSAPVRRGSLRPVS